MSLSVQSETPTPGGEGSVYAHLDRSELKLASVKAAVYDPASDQMIVEKKAHRPAPIASITKLMTAMVVLDGGQDLNEMLSIRQVDRRSEKNAWSRMRVGSRLSRRHLLRIMLMASENLAAANLADYYPGGYSAFVEAMNNKAAVLGMQNTRFAGPSGLSVDNRSTAADLVKMVAAAAEYPLIRSFSTSGGFTARFENPRYRLRYGNTNRLVHRAAWDIALSKTGYLNEAGRCLAMVTRVGDGEVLMVLLDSFGKLSPIGDAGRVKRWLTTGRGGTVAGAALRYEQRKSASYE